MGSAPPGDPVRAGPPQAEQRARRSLDEATTPAAAGRAIADCRRAADVVRRTADPAATVAGKQHELRVDLIATTSLPGSVFKQRLRLMAGNGWTMSDVTAA